jgi:thiol:disulfide interchange protein
MNQKFCTQCGAKISHFNEFTPSPQANQNPPTMAFQNNNLVQPTNGLAVAGFVLSILGCGFPLGLILSAISLGQFKKDPFQKGKGLAIAGVVIGSISVVFVFIYIVAFTAALSGY